MNSTLLLGWIEFFMEVEKQIIKAVRKNWKEPATLKYLMILNLTPLRKRKSLWTKEKDCPLPKKQLQVLVKDK